ncbi:MAG TPA: hypothetical protein PK014_12265 [Thermoanaerobaculia bacterium]|nr:hypothetical protein [Thermoanaerobaculia bacterium]HUM30845.1 hypothetical protein [Thermoanaerobaculia bacterium]HXK69174.1 hypothetical protein [Thermoanaerobaculia bacterium]
MNPCSEERLEAMILALDERRPFTTAEREHLELCPDCRRIVSSHTKLQDQLTSFSRVPVSPQAAPHFPRRVPRSERFSVFYAFLVSCVALVATAFTIPEGLLQSLRILKIGWAVSRTLSSHLTGFSGTMILGLTILLAAVTYFIMRSLARLWVRR